MRQSHAGLDFVAMLPARSARNEKLKVAVTLQRVAIGRIQFSQLALPCSGSSLLCIVGILLDETFQITSIAYSSIIC